MRIEATPASEAAQLALAIYSDILDAVNADTLTSAFISVNSNRLRLGDQLLDLGKYSRIIVVGAGKASGGMAAAVDRALGDRISTGVVVTKHGHGTYAGRIRIMEAGHPTPDEASVTAGEAIFEAAQSAAEGDLLLCLLSGGASSLMELPRPPATLDDLRATTNLLLRAGAPIQDLNAVRACLSLLKAGGLARAAAPAKVVCLVLSDVLGNPLEVIGSGPCVGVPPDPARARAVLDRYGLSALVPPSVRELVGELPLTQLESAPVAHYILGDIHTALNAARESAARHGLRPLILTGWLEGEAREVGRVVGALARDLPSTAQQFGADCLILGGETTVTVRGGGLGGRSQEIACAALESLTETTSVAILAGSTDGTDGPTDAAGALAEQAVYKRARDLELDTRSALRENNTLPFLQASGGLIKTGPTHSNVGDVVLIVMREAKAL